MDADDSLLANASAISAVERLQRPGSSTQRPPNCWIHISKSVLNAETQSRGKKKTQRTSRQHPQYRRDPGRQGRPGTAGSGNRSKNQLSSRFPDPAACATAQVSPIPSPFLQSRMGVFDARQIRHAGGVPDGGKRGDSERWRSEAPRFSPATGDRRSSVDLPTLMATPHKLAIQVFAYFAFFAFFAVQPCARETRAPPWWCSRPGCTPVVPLRWLLCFSVCSVGHRGCNETVCDGSASICVICGRSLSVSPCLRGFLGVTPSCLCVFVFATKASAMDLRLSA